MENVLFWGIAAFVAFKSGVLDSLRGTFNQNAAQPNTNPNNGPVVSSLPPRTNAGGYYGAAGPAGGQLYPPSQPTDWGGLASGIGSGLKSLIGSFGGAAPQDGDSRGHSLYKDANSFDDPQNDDYGGDYSSTTPSGWKDPWAEDDSDGAEDWI